VAAKKTIPACAMLMIIPFHLHLESKQLSFRLSALFD